MLDCKILTTEAEIEALADSWRDLHARTGRRPVTDYDRFYAWWSTVGKKQMSRSLHVVAGFESGRLAGLLPLSVERRRGMRMLQSDGGMVLECCDMLCENATQASELWKFARQSPLYDFAHVRNIYSESIGYESLSSFARPREDVDSFFLRFEHPTGEAWLASLSGNTRGNFRRCTRRLEEKGPLTYTVYEGGPMPKTIIDGLVKQKLAWANRREKHGMFDHANITEYFHRLTEATAANKQLFLAWLQCGENVIAYNLGFIHNNTLRMYFWTYDPAWAALSPGNVIMVNSICYIIDKGLIGIDFMHTTESDSERYFKLKYANEKQTCTEFTFSRSLYGRIMENVFIWRRYIHRMRKRRRQASQNKTQRDAA